MLHQIQYRFKAKPTRRMLEAMRREWLHAKKNSHPPPVVPIRWLDHSGTPTRRAALNGYRGTPGIVKCYGRRTQTLCDIDRKKPPALWQVWRIARLLCILPLWTRVDKTRHGWHMIVEWSRPFRPIEIVALQCILGSDLKRETYNFGRVMGGKARNRRWNLLFEEKL